MGQATHAGIKIRADFVISQANRMKRKKYWKWREKVA